MSSKVDYLALLCGPPGHGKTSLAAHLAQERLRAGRWVLVQDAGAEYATICKPYESTAAFLRELGDAAAAKRSIPRGATFPVGADDVLELARTLGTAWNKGHATTPHPICVVVNEASSSSESSPSWMGKLADLVVNQRRHIGIELIYCFQRPTQLHPGFFESATHAFIFQQMRGDAIDHLENRLGIERGSLAHSRSLGKHRYIPWTSPGAS